MEWYSKHLFIHDNAYHDEFLTEYLKPFVNMLLIKNKIDKFFFIRYWQGGPHIRFRYKANAEYGREIDRDLDTIFKDFLESYVPKNLPSKEKYNEAFSGNKEGVENLYWYEDKTIASIDYERELSRYGGQPAIEYSEDIFNISSNMALTILEKSKSMDTLKIIGALDLMVTALSITEHKEEFLKQYSYFWSNFTGSNKEHSDLVDNLVAIYEKRYLYIISSNYENEYKPWKEALSTNFYSICKNQTSYKSEAEARSLILASHIHMTNNRIGLVPQYESILAKVILKLIVFKTL